mmetsp:Transcript_14136/g.32725  ORF Transcript_14136/g.32725 Transcript_14136/m.32725 type:complete len:93 (-) Transcript_14136:71-349(-)
MAIESRPREKREVNENQTTVIKQERLVSAMLRTTRGHTVRDHIITSRLSPVANFFSRRMVEEEHHLFVTPGWHLFRSTPEGFSTAISDWKHV